MRDYFKLKTWLILAVMLVIGIGSAFLIVCFGFKNSEEIAQAEGSNNVAGSAWSENIGWISFNCSNDNSCDTVDYGVNVDSITGDFSGYAWSDNVGWISFNRSDTGAPPAQPYQDGAETIIAHYDSATEEVLGWAKILSLGDGGWIKFSSPVGEGLPLEFPPFPLEFSGIGFGVSIPSGTNNFSGWAWNTGAEDTGIGWISFNCANVGAGGCTGHDYKVTLDAPPQSNTPPQVINAIAPNWTYEQACSLYARQAFLRWEFRDTDSYSSQSAYQIIVDDENDPNNPLPLINYIASSTASQYSVGSDVLDYNKTYYWWVKVWDNFDVASELTAGLSFTTYKHEFPDQDFTWSPISPSKDEETRFTSSATAYGGATVSSLLWTAPDSTIDDSATSTPTIIFSSSGSHPVTLKVTDSDGYYCRLTKTIKANLNLPNWKEVRPE